MEWIDYVGENFIDEDGKRFHAEAFDEQHGFMLRNLNDINDRQVVPLADLILFYRMDIDCSPPEPVRSVSSDSKRSSLLEHVLFNMEAGMPNQEINKVMKSHGYRDYDIQLAIKGAEIIVSAPPTCRDFV